MFARRTVCAAFHRAPSWLSLALWTLGVPAIGFSGGCGDRGVERVVMSGTVTYNGTPIPEGAITSVPDAQSSAPTSGASIVNGMYKIDIHGGIPVGTHKIQIEAFRFDKSVPSRYPEFGARIQYLPEKYNVNTELEISIPPGSQTITKNFDLTD